MKKRLDVILYEKGLVPSRQKAQNLILSGNVLVNGAMAKKSSETFDEDGEFVITEGNRYVSRGGLKLERAVNVFDLDIQNRICIDVGASTGGFTDVMLQNGAEKVYSVDVGYGQLDYSLRTNERVVVMERTNARYITPDMFEPLPSFAGIDASFISLKLLLEPLSHCLEDGALIAALIKPQFEAGKGKVGKNGVVHDKNVHCEVVEDVISYVDSIGLGVIDLNYSPITGPKGNIEFLLLVGKKSDRQKNEFVIKDVVEEAHLFHKK